MALLWRVLPPGYITLCSLLKSTDVSVEYIASIFRIEEWTKQETNMKQVASTDSLRANINSAEVTYLLRRTKSEWHNDDHDDCEKTFNVYDVMKDDTMMIQMSK
jgi:hypothetical protein